MKYLGYLASGFGALSLLASAGAFVAAAILNAIPGGYTRGGYLFILGLMILVSAALLISGRLQIEGNPLAAKALPASAAAYLLFLLMASRWLQY